MSMLACGGITKLATIGLVVLVSSSVGRRSVHMGCIFILWFFSSYLMRPRLERNLESSSSLTVEMASWLESWSRLCHVPFLMAAKSVSILKFIVGY